jgi:glutathione S-transferase
MTLHFYYAPLSCALASHIVLEHLGADYEAHRLNLRDNDQQSPAYLSINPKGRVPALVTDRGILTETPAILLYLAQTYLEAKMAPLDDPFALAQMQSINAWLCSTVHVAHAHGARGRRWADDAQAQVAMKAKVAQNMVDCFNLVESEMLRGPWVMGEQFSVADAYLFTMSSWLKGDGVEIQQFPSVAAHSSRMLTLPAVQRVAPLHGIALD